MSGTRSSEASRELERQIGWYPGHMVKATRRMREYLRAIDVVVEVVDARIPRSGRNALLDELAGKRPRVIALTREDLTDQATSKRWLKHFTELGRQSLAVDSRAPRSVARIAAAIASSTPGGAKPGTVRAMIVGVPNSGKSTIVNSLLRRAAAKTEDRAGVTRHLQWFRLSANVELMDTPGVLPPKISSIASQWKLALCRAIPRDLYDPQEVVNAFYRWLIERFPTTGAPGLDEFAQRRGFLSRGGRVDYDNAAHAYISAFNDGAFGRISLEAPDDAEAA